MTRAKNVPIDPKLAVWVKRMQAIE
jgi:hypothetical protein